MDPEQIQKLQEETGFNYRLQADLAECRLDAEVAQLLFYCHKLAVITRDNMTIEMACGYISHVRAHLARPTLPNEFWTVGRRRYLGHLRNLRREIQDNRRLAGNDNTGECIANFLNYIDTGWGIA